MANAITAKSLLDDETWGKVALGLLRASSDPLMQSYDQGGGSLGVGPDPKAHTIRLTLSIYNLTDEEITGFFKAHGLNAKADRKHSDVVIEVDRDHDKLQQADRIYHALDRLRNMVRGPMAYKGKNYTIFLGFRGDDDAKGWAEVNAGIIERIKWQFRDFGIQMKQAGDIEIRPGSHAPTTEDSKHFYDEAHVRFAPADQQNRLALEKLGTRISTLQAMLEGRTH